MSSPRRLLISGALIAIPVAFAVGSVVLAQIPPSPQIPSEPVSVQLAPPAPVPSPRPAPSAAPTKSSPVAPPAPAPAPAPVPAPNDDDDDDDGGNDD